MLNSHERYKVVKLFRICTIAGPLPFEVDLSTWRLNPPSTKKKWICGLSYGYLVLLALYKIGSLAHAYLFVSDVQLHQLIIHAITAMASSMAVFTYYVAYLSDPGLFIAYFKMTLHGRIQGPPSMKDAVTKNWTKRLPEYSMQDLITISLPPMIVLAVIFVIASFIYDPTLRLLLYAALPSDHQTVVAFGLCLVEEFRYLIFLSIIDVPIWQLQVMSFDLVNTDLESLTRKIQCGFSNSISVYRLLRRLQLYMSMVNDVNSYVIFTIKLYSISTCIVSGYAAIAHFGEHPVFGVMFYVLVLELSLIYTLFYEKAFKIPQLFHQAAQFSRLRSRGSRKSAFRKQMLSIPPVGVKVGHFHKMERASTLNFLDYVVVNIVNMLVAYG